MIKKKTALKVVKETVEESAPAVKKAVPADLAWRQKRERVHKGLTNANVEAADG